MSRRGRVLPTGLRDLSPWAAELPALRLPLAAGPRPRYDGTHDRTGRGTSFPVPGGNRHTRHAQGKSERENMGNVPMFSLEWVKRLLYERGCFGGSVEDSERALLPGMLGLGFADVHEALGWIPSIEERLKAHEERLRNDLPETTDRS